MVFIPACNKTNHFKITEYSPVAQSVEQVAVNHPVAGSSPARGAIAKKGLIFQ